MPLKKSSLQPITCAAATYDFGGVTTANDYFLKVENLVREAAQNHAQVLLLPEYAGYEWAWTLGDDEAQVLKTLPRAMDDYCARLEEMAMRYHLTLIPGTLPSYNPILQKFMNRAFVFSKTGKTGHQDKICLTESEKADGYYGESQLQTVFKADWGCFGIAICYDVEFQSVVSNLVRHGADFIFVPSYTPSRASMNRVEISARARAHENQCYVMKSSARGSVADWGEFAIGAASIYGPIAKGFNDTGEQSNISNAQNLFIAHCDMESLSLIRSSDDVTLYHQQAVLLDRFIDLRKASTNT